VLMLAFASTVLLGSYAITTSSSSGGILPPGLLDSAIDHLAYVFIGMGALPVVFGVAFALATLGQNVEARPHALATVLVVVVVATTLAVASFDLRFIVQGRTVQERYLFYICPLLFAGAVGWFGHGRGAPVATALAAFGTAGVILSQSFRQLPLTAIEGFASPNRYFFAVIDGRLAQAEGDLGLHSTRPAIVIAAACVLLPALAVALMRSGRGRLALAGFGISVGAFLAAQLVYVLPRVVNDHNAFVRTLIGIRPLASRDWVDEHVSGSTGVVEVGPPFNTVPSWDLEFWNRSVDRVYRLDGVPGDELTPLRQLTLNFGTGAVSATGGPPPHQLVVAAGYARFAPEYEGVPVTQDGLTLYRTPVPYRADWASRSISEDGWTLPGKPVVVRVYARRGAGPELRRMRIVLATDPEIGKPRRYTLIANGRKHDRVVRTKPITEQLDVCPPAGGHTDVKLDVHGSTKLRSGLVAGLRVLQIKTVPTGRSCRPG
jgi:hypothetical protein